jgi:hypothetical protein
VLERAKAVIHQRLICLKLLQTGDGRKSEMRRRFFCAPVLAALQRRPSTDRIKPTCKFSMTCSVRRPAKAARFTQGYRTKNRLRLSDGKKAFIVKSLIWFPTLEKGGGRKSEMRCSATQTQHRQNEDHLENSASTHSSSAHAGLALKGVGRGVVRSGQPQGLPRVYGMKNRFHLSDGTKAFVVKSLKQFYTPRNGDGRKGACGLTASLGVCPQSCYPAS